MAVDARAQAKLDEQRALRRMFFGDDGMLSEDGKLALQFICRQGYVFQRTDLRDDHGRVDQASANLMDGKRILALEIMHLLGLDLMNLVISQIDERTERGSEC